MASHKDYRNGFPGPGEQNPTPKQVMEEKYFVNPQDWEGIRKSGDFDFIVLGSGFTALGFVHQVLSNNPNAKIMVLERGEFWLPEHFQNLPLPYKFTLGGISETFPWTLTEEFYGGDYLKFLHGSCPFFGGRSTFWSAWCPTVTAGLQEDWPAFLQETLWKGSGSTSLLARAKALMNVIPANQILDDVYGQLQAQVEERLLQAQGAVVGRSELHSVESAPMAVSNWPSIGRKFSKFSTPGPFLSLYERQLELSREQKGEKLYLVTGCVAQKLGNQDGMTAQTIETSRGRVKVGKAKVVLAMGCVPPCTLLLNSFPNNGSIKENAGQRLTGHFISHFTARIPRKYYDRLSRQLELGAVYVAHKSELGQYHMQITVIANPDPDMYAQDAGQDCPDYAAAATAAQLEGSEDYVLFVCAPLGEIGVPAEGVSAESWVKKDDRSNDCTTNVKLQVKLTEKDLKLWDHMDAACVDTIRAMATHPIYGEAPLEFWHDGNPWNDNSRKWRIKGTATKGHWSKDVPKCREVREPGAVHEASTLWMGEDPKTSVVGPDYRPHGIHNVYVTGGSLFPSSGSWNPTLTMVALAMDCANKLSSRAHPMGGPGEPRQYKWRMGMDCTTSGHRDPEPESSGTNKRKRLEDGLQPECGPSQDENKGSKHEV